MENRIANFLEFNDIVNCAHGLGNMLPEIIAAYMKLAEAMNKKDIAKKKIGDLPPASSLNGKDERLDFLIKSILDSEELKKDRVR